MNRKIIAIIVLGLVLLASLLACGYFGVKAVRRTRLRRAAMTAYENKEYALAERLLNAYTRQDPNAEAEFVALANIYHEFGNTGMEAQMWQTASNLNPLKPEYFENMLTSAMKSASYALLHSILGRKIRVGEKLTEQKLYLYVIAAYRSGHQKDGDDAYRKAVEADPEAFHKNELGRMAEFMAKYSELSEDEREAFLSKAIESEDPMIRFEALYTTLIRSVQKTGEADDAAEEELLKQIVTVNYFVGTQLLADYDFSEYRFEDVFSLLDPYLKTIDDLNIYLLYAESCVFTGRADEIKTLAQKLRKKPGVLPILADYCDILTAYLENDEAKLAAAVRKSGKIINSPLSRFIRLRVAMASESFDEIRAVAQEIFSYPPFHDLSNRAMLACLDYVSREMQKPENQKEPSQMAELAKILADSLHGNRLLTEIILMDQYKKGLVKESDLTAALEQFPDDPLLQRLTAEYLILNGKAEQAMPILESILSATEEEAEQESDKGIRFLYMLALDQLERYDEAEVVFRRLVEQSEFDLDLLADYFDFCWKLERTADLSAMADKLETATDENLKPFASFFRAAVLFAEDKDGGEKTEEALKLLAATPNDHPNFTFYAANKLSEADRYDEAETKYKSLLNTYKTPSLILVNLSEVYHAEGDEQKALEAAKEAFELEKKSMLPAFIYAKRLSEAKRYEDAVSALNFPRHAVNYREDIVELWTDCMRHVIEKSMAEERFIQAEEQCKHLLVIAPDDQFGKENLEKVQNILKQKKDGDKHADTAAVPAA